jgi:hypothetical protein
MGRRVADMGPCPAVLNMLVSTIVVDDHVHVELRRDLLIDPQ